MKILLACFALSGLLFLVPVPADANPWSRVSEPHPGPAWVLGFYSAGCIVGARTLPLVGRGFQVMRPHRNRHHGHPALLAFIQDLATATRRRGWGRLAVGDLAQARGGPMAHGHRSHQTGLDVDIWLRLLPKPGLTATQAESLSMDSVVDHAAGRLNRLWSARYAELLRLASEDPRVQRIFVNPVIKQALCRRVEGRRSWLARLRPWWGHDAHFHVRLRCPIGGACEAQDDPPAGDGCDPDLDRWVEQQRQAVHQPPDPPARPRPQKPLPTACQTVLDGRWQEQPLEK